MKILLAEDDPGSNEILDTTLKHMGMEVVNTHDGNAAWEALQVADPPPIAILDWKMPYLCGDEICRRARAVPALRHLYIILVTGMARQDDIVAGLNAGANDYIPKPYNSVELQARLRVGLRVVKLQSELFARIHELETSLTHIKRLQGLLPICVVCKKIRNDQNYWQQVDGYFSEHADLRFNRSICPECAASEPTKFA
jgi:DNA-binding response OmpR family regulator